MISKMPKASTSATRRPLTVVFLTIFIDLAGFSIIFPLFPAMLEWYLPREGAGSVFGRLAARLHELTPLGAGHDLQTAVLFGGVLGSLYSVLQFAGSPLWGRISDRWGRRPVILFSLSGTALSYAAWAFSPTFAGLVAARFLGGLMSGNIAVATAVVADVTERDKRSRGMALVGIAFGLGFILGPALGGFGSMIDLTTRYPVLLRWGMHPFTVPALLALALSLVNLYLVWRNLPETNPPQARVAREVAETRTWNPTGSTPLLRRLNLCYFGFICAFAGMEFTLTFLAAERLGYGPSQNVRLFLFSGLVLLLAQGWIVRRYAHAIGEKRLALAGFAAGLGGLLALSQAGSGGWFYFGLGLMSLGVGLITPTFASMVSLSAEERRQGRDLGAMRAAGALARAAGPLIAAAVFWHRGSAEAYLAGAIFLIIPGLLLWGTGLAQRGPNVSDA